MNIAVNIQNLGRQLLPPHKRQPVRLGLIQAFLHPLQVIFAGFTQWCESTRMMVNVNSQVKIFEGYLRKKYNQPVAIRIVTFSDGLLLAGLEREGRTMMPLVGLAGEGPLPEVPLSGEIRENFGDADFIVYIPAGVDMNLIRAEIENYKQALITYKIIQN